jgi:hypothetical protein
MMFVEAPAVFAVARRDALFLKRLVDVTNAVAQHVYDLRVKALGEAGVNPPKKLKEGATLFEIKGYWRDNVVKPVKYERVRLDTDVVLNLMQLTGDDIGDPRTFADLIPIFSGSFTASFTEK